MEKSVFLVGGGNSLRGFDFEKLKDRDTIVVNKSLEYLPNATYFITMDFTALKKMTKIINISPTKIFIANFTKPYLQEKEGRIVDVRFPLIYKLEDFDIIIKSYKTEGMGIKFNDFRNGDNSGFCALQLAVVLGYEEIHLLGIDLVVGEETHFHKGYGESKEKFGKKLDKYYENFVIGINELKKKNSGIKIISCSPISKLNGIIPYKE
ncbi:unnamed protein product, partial [marine sediment metagenome]